MPVAGVAKTEEPQPAIRRDRQFGAVGLRLGYPSRLRRVLDVALSATAVVPGSLKPDLENIKRHKVNEVLLVDVIVD